jgi:hypothetical protein
LFNDIPITKEDVKEREFLESKAKKLGKDPNTFKYSTVEQLKDIIKVTEYEIKMEEQKRKEEEKAKAKQDEPQELPANDLIKKANKKRTPAKVSA